MVPRRSHRSTGSPAPRLPGQRPPPAGPRRPGQRPPPIGPRRPGQRPPPLGPAPGPHGTATIRCFPPTRAAGFAPDRTKQRLSAGIPATDGPHTDGPHTIARSRLPSRACSSRYRATRWMARSMPMPIEMAPIVPVTRFTAYPMAPDPGQHAEHHAGTPWTAGHDLAAHRCAAWCAGSPAVIDAMIVCSIRTRRPRGSEPSP
jgi:hypothetical protein